jgi:hypothetical protein
VSEHVLKVKSPYFEALLSGEKTFEVRENDRAFQRGDTLVLIDHAGCDCDQLYCVRRAGKPVIRAEITYVYSGDPRFRGVEAGYVVLGLRFGSDV